MSSNKTEDNSFSSSGDIYNLHGRSVPRSYSRQYYYITSIKSTCFMFILLYQNHFRRRHLCQLFCSSFSNTHFILFFTDNERVDIIFHVPSSHERQTHRQRNIILLSHQKCDVVIVMQDILSLHWQRNHTCCRLIRAQLHYILLYVCNISCTVLF